MNNPAMSWRIRWGRAPSQVVEKEPVRVAGIKTAVAHLDQQLQRMHRV
jgi:hypothetical protein